MSHATLASPAADFVEDCCQRGRFQRIKPLALWAAFAAYCGNDSDVLTDDQRDELSKYLKSIGVEYRRNRGGQERGRYIGVALRNLSDEQMSCRWTITEDLQAK